MKYSVFGPCTGVTGGSSATSGIMQINNPASATMALPKIYEWEVGPGGNSADNTYTVRLKRATTAGTWATAVTPAPLDKKAAACITIASSANMSAQGGVDVELGRWGFHMRGGYRWVAIPGGEYVLPAAFSNAIFLEWIFGQGTDNMNANLFFDE